MKAREWIFLSVILILAVILLRVTYCNPPKAGKADCPPADVLPPDTVEIIAPAGQVVTDKPLTVILTDSAAVDSLIKVFDEKREYYSGLVARLQAALIEKERDLSRTREELETVTILTKATVYEDSVKTDRYFHKWKVEAAGDILSYAFSVQPFCPAPQVPRLKPHRIGAGVGLQTASGAWRQVYTVGYSWKSAKIDLGYLPRVQSLSLKPEFQLSVGLEVPF